MTDSQTRLKEQSATRSKSTDFQYEASEPFTATLDNSGSEAKRTCHVGFVFNEYCKLGADYAYWLTMNPYINSSVYCLQRRNPRPFPHPHVSVNRWGGWLRSAPRSLRPLTRPLAGLVGRASWRRYLRQQQPDLLHVQYGDKAIRFLEMLRRTDIPFVVTFHGSDINCATYSREYCRGLEQVFEHAAGCHFVSRDLRQKGIDLGCPPEKATAFTLGVPAPQKFSVGTERTTSCRYYCVAALVPCKGHETLLSAFRTVKRLLPQAELHLIGEGPLRERLEWLQQTWQLGDSVTFHGKIPHAEVQRELAEQADVLILSSQCADSGSQEGSPTCIKEAGRLGIPCIGTDCGGIAEILSHGRTGLVVEQRDVQALAAAMHELGTSPTRRHQFGRAALERAEAEFDLDRSLQHLAGFYQQVLAATGRGT